MSKRIYLCIDLKSFYASVECVERGLDPMTTNLVVADPERSSGTICLAVSPSLKALGVPNRCRVFQIPSGLEYIKAKPRMKLYIDYSAEIYGVYLKYISKDDIHVYSIDEAFLDVTEYLALYHMTAYGLAETIVQDILNVTGIPAACGIGTNLYLAKVALDISAKHCANRMAFLDENTYRRTLWDHTPLTDFWRIGRGISERLFHMGITTMRQLAQTDEDILYHAFGVDAQYLIDHAFGREPTTIADIKAYRSEEASISSGQVLFRDYTFEEGILIVKEMADLLCLDLVDKGLVTDSIFLYVGYSRSVAKSSKGGAHLGVTTNSAAIITKNFVELYHRIAAPDLPIRRINLTFNHILDEAHEQYDLFTDFKALENERKISRAVLDIKKRYGKNALLKGMNLQEGATAILRNQQIGGHNSGET